MYVTMFCYNYTIAQHCYVVKTVLKNFFRAARPYAPSASPVYAPSGFPVYAASGFPVYAARRKRGHSVDFYRAIRYNNSNKPAPARGRRGMLGGAMKGPGAGECKMNFVP